MATKKITGKAARKEIATVVGKTVINEIEQPIKKERTPRLATFSLTDAPFNMPLPDGFAWADHKPLKKADFTNDAHFFNHKALLFETKAIIMRNNALEAEKYGDRKQRSKVKKITKMEEQINKLKLELEEQGIDIADILGAATETK